MSENNIPPKKGISIPEERKTTKQVNDELKYDEQLCVFYYEIEDFDSARRISDELLDDNCRNYTALFILGLMEEDLGNYREAIDLYNKILEVYQDDPQCLKHKALAELHCQNGTQAMEDINKSIDNKSDDPEAYIIRGMIQFHSYDRKKEAIIDYNKALKIEPDNICGLYNRGLTFLRIGNKQYAFDDLKKAANLGYLEAEVMIKKYFPEKSPESAE